MKLYVIKDGDFFIVPLLSTGLDGSRDLLSSAQFSDEGAYYSKDTAEHALKDVKKRLPGAKVVSIDVPVGKHWL